MSGEVEHDEGHHMYVYIAFGRCGSALDSIYNIICSVSSIFALKGFAMTLFYRRAARRAGPSRGSPIVAAESRARKRGSQP